MLARPAAPPAACDRNRQKLVAMATSFGGSKNKFPADIHTHSSINPENLAKIGPADFEIILV